MYRGEEFIRFERIGQPWLKEAAKRWARARLLWSAFRERADMPLSSLQTETTGACARRC